MSDDPPPRRPADRDAADPGPADQAAARQDLNATEDSIRVDIDRMATLEDEKAALDAKDPRIDAISDEVVRLADRVRREALVERQLGRELG